MVPVHPCGTTQNVSLPEAKVHCFPLKSHDFPFVSYENLVKSIYSFTISSLPHLLADLAISVHIAWVHQGCSITRDQASWNPKLLPRHFRQSWEFLKSGGGSRGDPQPSPWLFQYEVMAVMAMTPFDENWGCLQLPPKWS